MNSRERVRKIIAGEPADRCGFWLGNPHHDTWPILHEYFGTTSEEELRQKLNDDYRYPGLSPLEVAGSPLGTSSYLDALRI